MTIEKFKPAAILLISRNCPHCASLKKQLGELNNQGELSALDVINVEKQPEIAKRYNVRSVPWLKLGSYEFDQGMTAGELNKWIGCFSTSEGDGRYIEYLLLNGKLSRAIDWFERGNGSLHDALMLIIKPDVKINVRIGIGALMEHFEGSEQIRKILPQILEMLNADNTAIRADMCHFLTLTNDKNMLSYLQGMLKDEDKHVREIAQEGIDDLAAI